jgi:hypothetical protein
MELVEVVLQGVRGAPGLVRWSFPAGAAVIPAGPADQLVARAAYELLAGVQDGVVAGAGLEGAKARAAVVVVGRDQRRYRLLWEIGSGRRALQVMNGGAVEVVTTTQAEIVQALTAQVGFPQSDVLREICFSFVDDLPSRRIAKDDDERSGPRARADKPLPPGFDDAAPARRDADKPLPPGFDGAAPTSRWAGRPEAELRARLDEIKRITGAQVDVSALEFELDGLQKKTFELQARRKPLSDLDANIATVDAQLQRSAGLASLPADFAERSTRLLAARADHDKLIERLDKESQTLLASVEHLSEEVSGVRRRGGARPLQAAANDPLVRWGVVGGLGAILVGVLGGMAAEGLRWVALLDIPAFGVAVWGGIKLLGGLEEGASTRLKLLRIADERKRAQDRFGIDKEQLERLLEKHQLLLEQVPELLQSWQLRQELLTRRELLVDQREPLVADVAGVDEELAGNAARIKALEDQLAAAGQGYDPATAELTREADEIERVLRGELKAAAPAAPEPAPTDAQPAATTTPATTGGVGADVPLIMIRLASDLLVRSVDDTATLLGPRTSQLLGVLTAGRFTAMVASSRGTSLTDAAGQAVPFGSVPAVDRDLAVLALRCAIVEAITPVVGRLPIVFERSLDQLPLETAPLVVKALQLIGSHTQTMCFTQRRELAAAGVVVQGQAAPPPPQAAS